MSNYLYAVVFYSPGDDGSHPYGDWKRRFFSPEEAYAYGDAEVQRMWDESRSRSDDKDWFDRCVEKEIFVVEVRRE